MKTAEILVIVLGTAASLASCSAGGGGGHGVLLSGEVLSPAGQVIGFEAGDRRTEPGHGRELALPGLLPVPDGTTVELVRLDDLGAVVETLSSTTTAGGAYAFDLTMLGLGFASDLAVTAGSGAARMRALAAQSPLDVDPLSEAVVQLILQQGPALTAFTLKEAGDLDAATRLLAATQGLEAQTDVAATVDLVRQAVLADPALAGFLAGAAEAGQTSAGPGDVGDYFPSAVGDTWRLKGTQTVDSFPPQAFERSRRIGALDLDGVQTVEEEDSSDRQGVFHERLEERSDALVNHGNDHPDDPLSPAVVPYDEAHFPLR